MLHGHLSTEDGHSGRPGQIHQWTVREYSAKSQPGDAQQRVQLQSTLSHVLLIGMGTVWGRKYGICFIIVDGVLEQWAQLGGESMEYVLSLLISLFFVLVLIDNIREQYLEGTVQAVQSDYCLKP